MEHGGDELPDEETEWEEYEDEYWIVLDQLKQARLNVLKRQGDDEAFLSLAKKSDVKRYTLKLIELGRVDEAVKASEKLNNTSDAFVVAQKLREVDRLNDAIALAERGLKLKGYDTHQLALWLAPLEESQDRTDMALLAYCIAYEESRSIEIYRASCIPLLPAGWTGPKKLNGNKVWRRSGRPISTICGQRMHDDRRCKGKSKDCKQNEEEDYFSPLMLQLVYEHRASADPIFLAALFSRI